MPIYRYWQKPKALRKPVLAEPASNLTTEERAELAEIRRENLTGMSDERYRRFVWLVQKERGVEVAE